MWRNPSLSPLPECRPDTRRASASADRMTQPSRVAHSGCMRTGQEGGFLCTLAAVFLPLSQTKTGPKRCRIFTCWTGEVIGIARLCGALLAAPEALYNCYLEHGSAAAPHFYNARYRRRRIKERRTAVSCVVVSDGKCIGLMPITGYVL